MSRKYFGTDGVRGTVGEHPLTVDFVLRLASAAARVLAGEGPGRAETPADAVIDGRPDVLSGGLPLQILEADSIADPTVLWPGVDGFQDKFTALWGL